MLENPIAITGLGAVCASGLGLSMLTGALADPPRPVDVTDFWDGDMLSDRAHVLRRFSVREQLGRKGTSFLDRSTAFGLVAAGEALESRASVAGEVDPMSTGVVVGTGAGSLTSLGRFATESLTQERPHLVDAMAFPNAVLNSVAGQTAIRFGLHGLNATVAGGPTAALRALRYAAVVLAAGRAECLLVGGVQECGPYEDRMWHSRYAEAPPEDVPGEGAAMVAVEDAGAVAARGGSVAGTVLAVDVRGGPHTRDPRATGDRLAESVRRVLVSAGVDPEMIGIVLAAGSGTKEHGVRAEEALDTVLGGGAERVRQARAIGSTGSAASALALAAVLGSAPAGSLTVVAVWSDDGEAAAAVVRR